MATRYNMHSQREGIVPDIYSESCYVYVFMVMLQVAKNIGDRDHGHGHG